MTDNQQWAHPHKIEWTHPDAGVVTEFHHGMSMRQWYKGMAPMNKLEFATIEGLAKYAGVPTPALDDAEALVNANVLAAAKFCGAFADAMLAEDAEHEENDR